MSLLRAVPPVIQTQPNSMTTISERESFSLSCTASGNPPPSITWVREDNTPLNNMATVSSSITPATPVTFVSLISSDLVLCSNRSVVKHYVFVGMCTSVVCLYVTGCGHYINFVLSMYTLQVSSTLMVPSALYSDSGRYRCSANNMIPNPALSDFAEVLVRGK